MTTTGTWHPPSFGTGGFLHEGQLFTNPPFAMTTNINEAPNRDSQHGGMERVGVITQQLKASMREGVNWRELSLHPAGREALDMIAHKIGRILSGTDPHDREHWEDLAGYAHAAMRTFDLLNGVER
jgi:hypothetical protein